MPGKSKEDKKEKKQNLSECKVTFYTVYIWTANREINQTTKMSFSLPLWRYPPSEIMNMVMCGISCSLIKFQIISELLEYHNQTF